MLPTNLLLIVIHRKHDCHYSGECNGYHISAKDRKQFIKQCFLLYLAFLATFCYLMYSLFSLYSSPHQHHGAKSKLSYQQNAFWASGIPLLGTGTNWEQRLLKKKTEWLSGI